MRSVHHTVALATLIAAFASPAPRCLAGQQPNPGQILVALTAGLGSANVHCDICDLRRETAFASELSVGYALSREVVVGAEFGGWIKDQGFFDSRDITESIGTVAAAGYYFPDPLSGFFVKGGVGMSWYHADGPGTDLTGTGPGLVLGTGFDLSFGPHTSVRFVASHVWGNLGRIGGGSATFLRNWKQDIISLTVGLRVR